MFVHEHQAKQLLKRYEFSFAPGGIAQTATEAGTVAEHSGATSWVVKAQILAGDRGRYGGIRLAKSVSDVVSEAGSLLNSVLVTPQTGRDGIHVKTVYIEQELTIGRELYLAMSLDRYQRELVILASKDGGSGIESVVSKQSNSLQRLTVHVDSEPSVDALRRLAVAMELDQALSEQYIELCLSLYRAVIGLDALSIELNPLAVVSDNRLIALDVKMELDDNAVFRHQEYQSFVTEQTIDNRKFRAQSGYNYARLEGDIGLLVGGAGLALATMDLLHLHQLQPANFLDLPPIASRSDVASACQAVVQDTNLKALFVNAVGGGLTHCDTIAEGLITAHKKSRIRCPVVVRFAGTKREHGLTLLRNSRIPFQFADTMGEAIEILLRQTKG